MDWSLRACARSGHVTYAPDEADLAARLHVVTPIGEAWRCLRCGEFVLGAPVGSGPAADAPPVLRGRALREATVLRLFAVERWLRALLLAVLGYGAIRFRSNAEDLETWFNRIIPAAQPLADLFRVDLSRSAIVERIGSLFDTSPTLLLWIALGLFGYAALQVAEGVGLWSLQRWGEYLAVVAASALLPLELYELAHAPTVFKGSALLLNTALVAYLVIAKRLFGVRGGAAAAEAVRAEASVLEVEAATLSQR